MAFKLATIWCAAIITLVAMGGNALAAATGPATRPADIGSLTAGDLFPDTAALLHPAGWEPGNRQRLIAFLQRLGRHGSGYNPAAPPIAVFDWDNTSIFNDIGEATFQYQARTLQLKCTGEALAAILPETSSDKAVSFTAERRELLDSYRILERASLVGEPGMNKAWATKATDIDRDAQLRRAYGVLRYRLVWFYQQLDQTDGATVACSWLARFYAGLTPVEFGALMAEVLRYELRDPVEQEPCRKLTILHPDADARGNVHPPLTINQGIVATPQVQELMAALRAQGFEVYVVTASYQGTVAAIAATYGVPSDHIIGVRLAPRPDGLPGDQPVLPIPYRQGKVDNIRKYLPRPPVFVGGDSDGDVEMLEMPGVQMRLIVNRNKSGDIARLYEKAKADPEHYLLQGRNDYNAANTARGTWNGLNRSTAD